MRDTMRVHRFLAVTSVMLLALGASRQAPAQTDEPSIPLVVDAGRPLRVALDRKITVKRVGQPVTATLIEPVYAHDRIVVPMGTKVIGHIEKLESAPKGTRVRAILSGDFTPPRYVRLQFDTLVLSNERTMPIQTSVTEGSENVTLQVAGASKRKGIVSRARGEIAREAKQAVSAVKAPGKLERLKDMAIRSLPYHPRYLRKGTVYSARLLSPLEFGSGTPTSRAAAGTAPAPESILNARLMTPLHSATAPPGTAVEAVVTQPVFSADRQLILPEGARLMGQVTFSKPARRFHRHGQLRFLFESVHAPDGNSEKLLASLYSVESRQGDRVALDEEGGATTTSSKARLIAPGLAALALVGSMHGRLEYDPDDVGPELEYGGVGSSTLGGFLGLSVMGIGLNQLGRPVTVGIGVVSVARTVYSTVFGKGRDISFPADTSIQVQLAPGSSSTKQ